MKFGFEIKYTLIWDNLNVKWNGFKNEYLKLKFERVEILKIKWFEMGEVLLKFIQVNYYWNLFKYECFKLNQILMESYVTEPFYNLDFWI